MRNEVVGLKYETDTAVAIGVPIDVVVFFGGDGIYLNIAVCVAVKTADNVQQCGFSATGRT